MDAASGNWLDAVGDAPEPQHRRLCSSRDRILFLALLPALWNSVPCGDIAVQHLFLQAAAGNSQAGPLGRFRRASGSGEIFWREDLRRLYLEAHARFLFLR